MYQQSDVWMAASHLLQLKCAPRSETAAASRAELRERGAGRKPRNLCRVQSSDELAAAMPQDEYEWLRRGAHEAAEL